MGGKEREILGKDGVRICQGRCGRKKFKEMSI